MVSSPRALKSLFKRKRAKVYLLSILLSGFLFIIYQLVCYIRLAEKEHIIFDIPRVYSQHLIGVHPNKYFLYKTGPPGIFLCFHSKEIISYYKVNDDYCDCKDGSDEPGTSACSQSVFYCASQCYRKGFRTVVPSSWVNDGICDCCDGSDEWEGRTSITTVDKATQKHTGRYVSPCPNLCSSLKQCVN